MHTRARMCTRVWRTCWAYSSANSCVRVYACCVRVGIHPSVCTYVRVDTCRVRAVYLHMYACIFMRVPCVYGTVVRVYLLCVPIWRVCEGRNTRMAYVFGHAHVHILPCDIHFGDYCILSYCCSSRSQRSMRCKSASFLP